MMRDAVTPGRCHPYRAASTPASWKKEEKEILVGSDPEINERIKALPSVVVQFSEWKVNK